jgi:hypothetical protein
MAKKAHTMRREHQNFLESGKDLDSQIDFENARYNQLERRLIECREEV